MDKTIIDIISVCVGWVGLYGAIKKANIKDFETVFNVNLKNYKTQVIENYKNNISILITLIVFLSQIIVKIFENQIPTRLFSYPTYIIFSLISIVISAILYWIITIISKFLAQRKYFPVMKHHLFEALSQVQTILLKNPDYHQIEKSILFFEDILELPIIDNNLEKRFDLIKKKLSDCYKT